MIKVNNISRYYGNFRAVKDVSFEIRKGEIVGLLGHNGAGKTTIMKMLTGFLEASQGEIKVGGYDIENNLAEIQNLIGYLPETSPVYPEMKVVQYLEYVGKLRGIPEKRLPEAIKTAISKTALQEKALAVIGTLSKGLRQRVGLAQAIIHQPQILILDEPTSGLDPSQIQEVRNLVKELSANSTIILSTHILQEVEATCNRVIIILRGEVAADSKLSDLQRSNRIKLIVDQKEAAVSQALKTITGVNEVRFLGNGGPYSEFAIDVSGEMGTVAPKIAEQVVGKGWKLFGLEQEQHNLETIFRNINKDIGGGANVK